jgi:hypothetical protein
LAFNVTSPAGYCVGENGVTITLSGSETGVNYQLYKNDVAEGSPVAGTGMPLAWDNMTFGTYHVVATDAEGGCMTRMNLVAEPVVNVVTGGKIGSDQVICENSIPYTFTNEDYPTGVTGAMITYQWQIMRSADAAFSDIAGAMSAIYTHNTTLNEDVQFRRRAFATIGTGTGAVVCSAYSDTVFVRINRSTPGTIAANQIIPSGGTPATFTSVTPAVLDPATGGLITYQWKYSTDGISFYDVPSTGTDPGTDSVYTADAITVDTWFRRDVIFTYGYQLHKSNKRSYGYGYQYCKPRNNKFCANNMRKHPSL